MRNTVILTLSENEGEGSSYGFFITFRMTIMSYEDSRRVINIFARPMIYGISMVEAL